MHVWSISACRCLWAYTYTRTQIHMQTQYVLPCLQRHTQRCEYMHTCMYAHTMHIRSKVYLYVFVHAWCVTCTWIRKQPQLYIYIYIYTCTHTHIYIHVHTYLNSYAAAIFVMRMRVDGRARLHIWWKVCLSRSPYCLDAISCWCVCMQTYLHAYSYANLPESSQYSVEIFSKCTKKCEIITERML